MRETTPIHSRYGLRIDGVQLADITAEQGYPEIRRAFEEHSLLHFPDQSLDDAEHLRLGALFGPREDRSLRPDQPNPAISMVSNVREDGCVYRAGDRRLLDLQSNMLWHTDSTFLPVPALANILVGRVVPSSGTATAFTSSRIAWESMPEALKGRARNLYFRHDYTHSRRKVDAALAGEEKFTHWGQQVWKSVWTNPVNGREALYIASHACGVVWWGCRTGQPWH
ncbi:MAG: TauD/TfdA family dioxygenase [Gammaproteobacteria bacterium]|nr:TauD/TfdA family dioxygenase [Gammaproteobacteria bacterium]